MNEPVYDARVISWQNRGETLFDAVVLFGGKAVFRAEEKATEQQARIEITEWADRLGKSLRWENGAVTQPACQRMLEPAEVQQLSNCEIVIKNGLQTFVEVGQALITIREGQLYRGQFRTFEEYVKKRWSMSVRHAHRLCDAAQVVQNLLPAPGESSAHPIEIKAALPGSESVARPLAKLDQAEQKEIWNEVTSTAQKSGKEVTARDVNEAVQKRTPSNVLADISGQEELKLPPAVKSDDWFTVKAILRDLEILDEKFKYQAGASEAIRTAKRELEWLCGWLEDQKLSRSAPMRKGESVTDAVDHPQKKRPVNLDRGGAPVLSAKRDRARARSGIPQFVIRRSLSGNFTFRTAAGGWSCDPKKARRFGTQQEAQERAHSYDSVVRLDKAADKFSRQSQNKKGAR